VSNPTRGALERALAVSEFASQAIAYSSGLGASAAVIQLLKSGDHVVALDDLFGGTSALFRDLLQANNGIQFSFTSMDTMEKVEAAVKPNTKMIWLESPTNPLLKTSDIKAIAEFAKKRGILLVVDNTFLSPYLQHPLQLGADIVVHSLTKYIGGHSDLVMGAAMTNNAEVANKLRSIQSLQGAVPSPFDCYLCLRGLKTLHVRVEFAQRNAMSVAQFLESHPAVEKVTYPGLPSYPQYELAKRQTTGPGAMISFYIKGGIAAARKFVESLEIFSLAVSLGAVESLANCPALMTHAIVPKAIRESLGLTDSLIRLSIGIEDGEDLVADLKQALDKALPLIRGK
jgi:cystathionine gamma-lyase